MRHAVTALVCLTIWTSGQGANAQGWLMGVGLMPCSELNLLAAADPRDQTDIESAVASWSQGYFSALNTLNGLEVGRGIEGEIYNLTKAQCVWNPDWSVARATVAVYGYLRP
jgi:hypothetical protein